MPGRGDRRQINARAQLIELIEPVLAVLAHDVDAAFRQEVAMSPIAFFCAGQSGRLIKTRSV